MTSVNSRGITLLIFGDLVAYVSALILTLTIRYGGIPSRGLFMNHFFSFSILFVLFVVVSFSAGLYDKQVTLIRNRIEGLLVRAQIINLIIGIAFFYFAPVLIAPKANLFIFFVVSTLHLIIWRTIMFPIFNQTKNQSAILVGEGNDIDDIANEVKNNPRYGLYFSAQIQPSSSAEGTVKSISEALHKSGANMVVADLQNPTIQAAMPMLYSLIFSGVQILDASKMYESIFDRIPLTLVGERWLVENSANALGNSRVYDSVKRLLDIIVASVAGLISLLVYPFVFIAIKLDDAGPLFITQDRMGKNGKTVKIMKFRSMTGNDSGTYGGNGLTTHAVTRVGNIIRVSRIDELPQLWNVFKGDLSLIGPRPELPSLVQIYEKEIPYYNTRHLVKPGLSGWAQIYHEAHPHHAVATEETRNKLSYD
ncbi:MAG: sugar transferase, partial [bacterium]|nr:sugar transferase [bacterium]